MKRLFGLGYGRESQVIVRRLLMRKPQFLELEHVEIGEAVQAANFAAVLHTSPSGLCNEAKRLKLE